ncbi:MAG: hypothetical protein CVT84_05280 [Alphaproteobacteria bacterium HGW-Alphaproteobacteria-6]|nr:MAG: hypothetical protein CVT84_05280 [Alphaproteobacteria bacterium HGW-Alphaproteobacteria-6]
MKSLLIPAALILATAGSVSAMTAGNGLSSFDRHELRQAVPGIEIGALTQTEIGAIVTILNGDNRNKGAEIRAYLK